jgi:hypothetical protein
VSWIGKFLKALRFGAPHDGVAALQEGDDPLVQAVRQPIMVMGADAG